MAIHKLTITSRRAVIRLPSLLVLLLLLLVLLVVVSSFALLSRRLLGCSCGGGGGAHRLTASTVGEWHILWIDHAVERCAG